MKTNFKIPYLGYKPDLDFRPEIKEINSLPFPATCIPEILNEPSFIIEQCEENLVLRNIDDCLFSCNLTWGEAIFITEVLKTYGPNDEFVETNEDGSLKHIRTENQIDYLYFVNCAGKKWCVAYQYMNETMTYLDYYSTN